jgi:hypothetical protein
MLLHNGKYECVLCGAEIHVTPDERQRVFIAVAGDRPHTRVLSLAGKELHACDLGTAWQNRDFGES